MSDFFQLPLALPVSPFFTLASRKMYSMPAAPIARAPCALLQTLGGYLSTPDFVPVVSGRRIGRGYKANGEIND